MVAESLCRWNCDRTARNGAEAVRKFVTIVGARPQFIKAAPLRAALATRVRDVLVHTGQHYDASMSDVFFKELALPAPDYHLGIGGGLHGAQTGAMLEAIERVLLAEQPDTVIVYGDTNSTLAGALAAAKLHIPVAHVEAGLRSFNRTMPEEINRIVADHLSSLLFAPSDLSRQQLAREGITRGVHVVGDIMYDAVLRNRPRAAAVSRYPDAAGCTPGEFYLCTIHRADNTDRIENLSALMDAINRLDRPIVFPVHPRTRKQLAAFGLTPGPNVRVLDPVGYLDMLQLLAASRGVLTDSGGIQKEAYYLGVPCITLRTETEWLETVTAGWNCLVGTDPEAILSAVRNLDARRAPPAPVYGSGNTADRIAAILTETAADCS